MGISICPWQIKHRSFNQSHKQSSHNCDHSPKYLGLATQSPEIYFLKTTKAFINLKQPKFVYTMYACKNVNGGAKESYPKIQAIANEKAGITLHMALAKLAVVYFIPV